MRNIKDVIISKSKMIVYPVLVVFVLISIFIFNGFQTVDSTIVTDENGTYIEASGIVENNSINISSEVTGIIDELLVKEGDKIKAGQVMASVNNTSLINQYNQAVSNMLIAEKNIELLESNLANYDSVNENSIKQAQSVYYSAYGEYEKLLEGASPQEIQQLEEAVNQADLNLKYIENNLNNSKKLLEFEAISKNQYDEVELKYNLAQAQLNSAQAQLDLVKTGPSDATVKTVRNKMLQTKASYDLSISNGIMQKDQLRVQLEIAQIQYNQAKKLVEQLKIDIDKLNITSPIDGTVNLLTLNKGEFTSPGKTIAEVIDNNHTEIKVYVSEQNIGHVKVGQKASIYTDAVSSKAFIGEVVRISSNAEFTPKNIQTKEERVNTVFAVKIQVENSDNVIKAGMPVDVNIKID